MQGMNSRIPICSIQAAQAQSIMLCHLSPSDKHKEAARDLQECALQERQRRSARLRIADFSRQYELLQAVLPRQGSGKKQCGRRVECCQGPA